MHIVINSSFIFRIASPIERERERNREGKTKETGSMPPEIKNVQSANREGNGMASRSFEETCSPSFPDVDQRYPCPFNSKNI